MTLVNADTGEIVAECTADEARHLTDQIKVTIEGTWHLIVQAYQSRAWAALGYSSWDDYCTREFGTSRLKLPRETRQEAVASLRDAGLSTRAIAAATGSSPTQVRRDLPPAPNGAPEVEPIVKGEAPKKAPPKPVTGLDGKTYQPKEPSKPKRSPLADQAQRAGWEFRKAVERIERIEADDRFGANKEQVAEHLRGHLTYAIEVCQDLLDRFDT